MNPTIASGYSQVRCWIDWLASEVHLKIQMRTGRETGISHDFELLACRDGSFTFSKRRGGHPQVTVDANEAIVLHQDFEAPWTLLLDTDHLARRRCHDRRTRRCDYTRKTRIP